MIMMIGNAASLNPINKLPEIIKNKSLDLFLVVKKPFSFKEGISKLEISK